MNAHKRMVVSDILIKDNIQFIVPIYQREYKWTPVECVRIVNDILNIGKSGKEHFIGSIVYQYTEFDMHNMRLYLVDGQQRLTTLMLITKALNLIAATKKDEDTDYSYVYNKTNRILYIDVDDPSRGFSIYPSENDRDVFNSIITSKSYDDIKNSSVISQDNYMLNNFTKVYELLLDAVENGENIKDVIYAGFLNLSVVEIIVEKDENAQIIFESINSLGVKLTNAELIQNYLLMSNQNQEKLYVTYWKPIKNKLIGEKNMETFVKHYLHMRLEYQINDDNIYKEYIKYAEQFNVDGQIDREALILDLFNVAQIYEPFLTDSDSYSKTTNKLMKEFRDMDQTMVYPFLMRIFLDHKKGNIDDDTLNKILNLIITYVVRRSICGVQSNTLRGFMLTLYKRIFKVKDNYNRYYQAIYAFLCNIRTNDVLRSESDTLESLKTYALYNNVKFATYLLNCLENGRYPKPYSEIIVADKISVEHIMPQQLTEEWVSMLGIEKADEIHDKYLDTLGNLSLSSRSKNSSMSNESFSKKKEILKAEKGKFIELNLGIDELERFGEKEICEREERLAEIFAEKYALPDVDISGIKFEDNIEVICDGEVNPIYQNSSILSYSMLGVETNVATFTQLIISVARQLYDAYPEVIRTLAAEHFNPWNNDSVDCIHFSYGEDDTDSLIEDNIRVHLGYNAPYCVQFCEEMMLACGLSVDNLSIFLKKDSIKGDSGVAKSLREAKLRQALFELAEEGLITYDYDTMPKSHTLVKFLIDELIDAIKYEGGFCSWDGKKYPYCCYVEYSLAQHELWISLRYTKDNKELFQVLNENCEALGIIPYNNGKYWHIKKYPIDYRKILDSESIVDEIKAQLIPAIEDIRILAQKIDEIYTIDDDESDSSIKKSAFRFSLCNISVGELIEYKNDSSLSVRVVDDRYVEYEGEVYSLTRLAKHLSGITSSISGTRYFKYNGELLNEIRDKYEKN